MTELIKFIVLSLVENKEAVSVTETEEESGNILVEVRVAPDEMGKIIGKNGRIAKAIRTVARSAAAKTNQKVRVDIIE
ncbi:MAG: KH domain-containing protein [Eubacteriales bacterium]|nr:KH domain-containing protein [Eubacteriales bacterium]